MIDENTLRQRMERIAGLVQRIDALPDIRAREQFKELLQAVMDFHGEALDRVVDRLHGAGEPGAKVLEALSADAVVSSALLLHGLHPLDFETRTRQAVERAGASLRSHGVTAELRELKGGAVRIQLRGVADAFTARTVGALLEEEIYAAAPDASSLVLLGLERFAAPDFVPLESVGVLIAGQAGE